MNSFEETGSVKSQSHTPSDLREAEKSDPHGVHNWLLTHGFREPNEHLGSDVVAALELGKNVLLRGPTGAGKTVFAHALAAYFERSIESINCSTDLDIEGLLGHKTLQKVNDDMSVLFVDGPVTRAMKQGRFLYIDEINVARPEVLPILNSVLDYRRQLMNPLTTDIVHAAPSFRVIAAMNEGYVGTTPLNEALKNRFVIIDVPYLRGDALLQVLQDKTSQENIQTLRRFQNYAEDLMEQVHLGQISEDLASIRSVLDACDLSTAMPPLRAIQYAMIAKAESEREAVLLRNLAETYFTD